MIAEFKYDSQIFQYKVTVFNGVDCFLETQTYLTYTDFLFKLKFDRNDLSWKDRQLFQILYDMDVFPTNRYGKTGMQVLYTDIHLW